MNEKIVGEVILKLAIKNKRKLIDKLIENLKNEGKLHILKNIIGYLKLKNIKMKNQEPAKLFLAFDYDEKEIVKLIKEKFGISTQIIEKKIDPSLILGGRMLTLNYIIDFSLKNVINKIFYTNIWKI